MQIRWRMSGCGAAIATSIGLFGASSVASESAACGRSGQPWVSITFSSGSWSESFKNDAYQDLKAGLSSRGIDTCAQGHGPATPPVAAIVISASDEENVRVTVEIRDAVTEKRVSRDVELANMPTDGRALAIAVAADELVWASWAEIAYSGTKRRKAVPPAVIVGVERAVQRAAPANPKQRVQLGAQLSAEHFGAGLTLFGADALAAVPLASSFRLKFAAGARQGLTVITPEGHIQSVAASLAIDGNVLILKGTNANLALSLGPKIAWVRLQGEAAPGSLGQKFAGVAVLARTGPRVELRLTASVWLGLDAGIGVPLRAVQATDSGHIVAGASGLEQSVALSLQGEI